MTPREFVQACRAECGALLADHTSPAGTSAVADALARAGLTLEQRALVNEAIGLSLTDAFYTLLLGLSGSASLGGTQQQYRLTDENGDSLSSAGADLEGLAFELFHED